MKRVREGDRARQSRLRMRLAAEMPRVVVYERDCNHCGTRYRGLNRLLCPKCFRAG